MNSYKLTLLYLLTLVLIIPFSSCDEDCNDTTNPFCENYDPCTVTNNVALNNFRTSANFKLYECIHCNWEDSMMRETDTIYGGFVIFEAQQFHYSSTYEWKIGTDPTIFREKSFQLDFSDFQGKVEIQLIVRKEPSLCFSDDDGVDTLVKLLTVLGSIPDSLVTITGVFEGYDEDNPNQIYRIEHRPEPFYKLKNFPNGCSLQPNEEQMGTAPGFSALRILSDDISFHQCGHPTGYGELLEDRKTLIIYYDVTEDNQRKKKKFIGKKIE